MVLYPTVSDYWNSFHQSKAVAGYVEQVENLDKKSYEQLMQEARNYNDSLNKGVIPDLNRSSQELADYSEKLNVTDTGIMSYVEIPKLNTTMPIYHGVDETVLQVAIGHIPGTSLPVGGIGTHSVISGHRGLPSAKLFTDIDQLVDGDIFYIKVLDQTLTYRVDQIVTVTPDDVSALAIDPEQDYVTLVTCTPYGVNSHRLLVRGHRIETTEGGANVISEATVVMPIMVAPFVGVGIFVLMFVFLLFRRYYRNHY